MQFLLIEIRFTQLLSLLAVHRPRGALRVVQNLLFFQAYLANLAKTEGLNGGVHLSVVG